MWEKKNQRDKTKQLWPHMGTISNRTIKWEQVNKIITSSISVYLHCKQKKISLFYLERTQGIPLSLILLDFSKGVEKSYNYQDFLVDEQWQVDFYSAHLTLRIANFKMAQQQQQQKYLQTLEHYRAWSSLWMHWLRKRFLQAAASGWQDWRSWWLQRSSVLVLAQKPKLYLVCQNFSKYTCEFIHKLIVTHLPLWINFNPQSRQLCPKEHSLKPSKTLEDELSSREQIFCPRCLKVVCLHDPHLTLEPTRIFRDFSPLQHCRNLSADHAYPHNTHQTEAIQQPWAVKQL